MKHERPRREDPLRTTSPFPSEAIKAMRRQVSPFSDSEAVKAIRRQISPMSDPEAVEAIRRHLSPLSKSDLSAALTRSFSAFSDPAFITALRVAVAEDPAALDGIDVAEALPQWGEEIAAAR